MILVSLYDSKAETWSNPHCVANKACAIREFAALCNDSSGTIVSKNPADFDLFQVASADDIFKGVIIPDSAPVHLANGVDFLQSK